MHVAVDDVIFCETLYVYKSRASTARELPDLKMYGFFQIKTWLYIACGIAFMQ